jgi:multidrug efflux pump subunit AcrB
VDRPVALDRPYTFIVFTLMIVILSGVAITRTPTDIFPTIDIPIVAVDSTYTASIPRRWKGG